MIEHLAIWGISIPVEVQRCFDRSGFTASLEWVREEDRAKMRATGYGETVKEAMGDLATHLREHAEQHATHKAAKT